MLPALLVALLEILLEAALEVAGKAILAFLLTAFAEALLSESDS